MFEHVVRKGGLRENEARWFFQQLIVAVDYIHRMVRFGSCRLRIVGYMSLHASCAFSFLPMYNPYLQNQGVANRDIKLENTLLDGSPRPLIKVRGLFHPGRSILHGGLVCASSLLTCAPVRSPSAVYS